MPLRWITIALVCFSSLNLMAHSPKSPSASQASQSSDVSQASFYRDSIALLLHRPRSFERRPAPKPKDDFAYKPPVKERDWRHLVIHHTATETGSVEMIHKLHLQRKDSSGKPWMGIGYHFVIGNGHGMDDGQIEATFRWNDQIHGAHAGNQQYNQQGIGICLVGNFEKQPPSEKQLESLAQLIESLSKRYNIPKDEIIGHRDVKPTACPGKFFPWDKLTSAIAQMASN